MSVCDKCYGDIGGCTCEKNAEIERLNKRILQLESCLNLCIRDFETDYVDEGDIVDAPHTILLDHYKLQKIALKGSE